MTTVVLSRSDNEVAVVGALNSMDEAVAMDQMRFVLAWAIRVQRVARADAGEAPAGPLPLDAFNAPSAPDAPSPPGTDGAPSGW